MHGVAARAGVARSFIYSHPALLADIRDLGGPSNRLKTPVAQTRATEDSLRNRLADALDRIDELEGRLVSMTDERERLLGELRSTRAENRALTRQVR